MSKASDLLGDIPKNKGNEEVKITSFNQNTTTTIPEQTKDIISEQPTDKGDNKVVKTNNKHQNEQQFSIYIPKDVYRLLDIKSTMDGITKSKIVNAMIKNSLDNEKGSLIKRYNELYKI